MDCYYSSDDEVAWGPLSLHEIKKEMLDRSRKIQRRETDVGACTFYTPSGSLSEEKSQDASTAGISVYHTADESLVNEEIPNKHERFLEKMNQVIEDVVETTRAKKDTLLGILETQGSKDCVLDSIDQSLIDNTIFVSHNEENAESIIEEESDEGSENEEIITISDESLSDLQEEVPSDASILVKLENLENYLSKGNTENNRETDKGDNEEHHHHSIISEERYSNQTNDDSLEKHVEDKLSTSGLEPFLSERPSYKFSSYKSSFQDLDKNKDTSKSNSLIFNDTMEEMEMALKQGLDYVMPEDDYVLPKPATVLKNSTNSQNIDGKKKLPKISKFDYIQSPVGDYIKKKSPTRENFKLPIKTVKKRPQIQNPKSPSVTPKPYKAIVSPIGMYIKNSPRVCIKQNVVAKTIPMLNAPSNQETVKNNKENCYELLGVVYKPGRKVVTSSTKGITLPSSIKKMIPETVTTTHTKTMQRQDSMEKLLHLEDVNLTTINSSLLNQTEENVSFVKTGHAFIK